MESESPGITLVLEALMLNSILTRSPIIESIIMLQNAHSKFQLVILCGSDIRSILIFQIEQEFFLGIITAVVCKDNIMIRSGRG